MKVNFGAGKWRKAGWTTVDRGKGKGAGCDVVLDFTKDDPWPFEQNSLDLAFCSHVLEHLNDADGLRLLKNIHSSLKPGGALRVIVPDFGYALKKFKENDREWFYDITNEIALEGETIHDRLASFVCRFGYVSSVDGGIKVGSPEFRPERMDRVASEYSVSEIVKWIMDQKRPQNAVLDHQNGFDAERLCDVLVVAGFIDPCVMLQPDYISNLYWGNAPKIEELNESEFFNRPKISLVIDAVKE